MHSVDSINFVFLKETVEKHGFPGISIIGSSGARKFWLLIQHQDLNPEFKKQLLVLMRVAVEQKEANASDYAYLYDRVCVNSGNLQLFGACPS
ncbi:MAG TPA: hypothetical protein DCD96_08210 [Flavobacteriales bacterium]|nr:hypothetical protein [Flavobacteriales bacterium]